MKTLKTSKELHRTMFLDNLFFTLLLENQSDVFKEWIINISKDRVRDIKCVSVILVERSIELKSLRQIGIG